MQFPDALAGNLKVGVGKYFNTEISEPLTIIIFPDLVSTLSFNKEDDNFENLHRGLQ